MNRVACAYASACASAPTSPPYHIVTSSFVPPSSSDGVLSTATKAYIDERFRKILADSQAIESRVHVDIDVLRKPRKEKIKS